MMNYNRLWPSILGVFLSFALVAFGSTAVPPDTRSWDEVTADFVKDQDVRYSYHGRDGLRLKEIDPKRAISFLLPFLAKNQPYGLRMKAVGGLGQAAFQEAIPALSEIAKDTAENAYLRSQVLDPGLRHMKSPIAVETALAVMSDKSTIVRTAAYRLLSEHGTDQAINALEKAFQTENISTFELKVLIGALSGTKDRDAGKTIFSNCDFSTLPNDENLLAAYCRAMLQYRTPEARQTMLLIAQQPDCRISAYYALQYFSSFPSEEVVPALIAFVTGHGDYSHLSLHETVTVFSKAPNITEESRKIFSDLLTSGRVKK